MTFGVQKYKWKTLRPYIANNHMHTEIKLRHESIKQLAPDMKISKTISSFRSKSHWHVFKELFIIRLTTLYVSGYLKDPQCLSLSLCSFHSLIISPLSLSEVAHRFIVCIVIFMALGIIMECFLLQGLFIVASLCGFFVVYACIHLVCCWTLLEYI